VPVADRTKSTFWGRVPKSAQVAEIAQASMVRTGKVGERP